MAGDLIKTAIKTALSLTNSGKSVPIYPAHISLVTNPLFPCVTLSTIHMQTLENQVGDLAVYQIDVWSKVGNDELWNIYLQIKQTINKKRLYTNNILIPYLRQTYVNDNLFDEVTRTHHLASRYQIYTM